MSFRSSGNDIRTVERERKEKRREHLITVTDLMIVTITMTLVQLIAI